MKINVDEYKYKVTIDQVGRQDIPVTTGLAKGDLLVYKSEGDAERLPLGNDGEVLMVDRSTELGVKWADIYATTGSGVNPGGNPIEGEINFPNEVNSTNEITDLIDPDDSEPELNDSTTPHGDSTNEVEDPDPVTDDTQVEETDPDPDPEDDDENN